MLVNDCRRIGGTILWQHKIRSQVFTLLRLSSPYTTISAHLDMSERQLSALGAMHWDDAIGTDWLLCHETQLRGMQHIACQ